MRITLPSTLPLDLETDFRKRRGFIFRFALLSWLSLPSSLQRWLRMTLPSDPIRRFIPGIRTPPYERYSYRGGRGVNVVEEYIRKVKGMYGFV